MEGIPVSEYRERVRKVQAFARSKKLEAVLAYSDRRYSMGQGVESGQNIRYLVGFNFPPSRIQNDDVVVPYMIGDSVIVVPAEGEPSLLLTRGEVERAKNQTWVHDIRTTAERFIDAKYHGLGVLTREVLSKKKSPRLGLAGTHFPMELYLELNKSLSKAKFSDCSDDLDLLRTIKSANELRIMQRAAEIADEGVRALIESSKTGVKEYEVHIAVEKAMFDAGGDNPWSVILSGPRSAISYMSPDYTQRKLRDGDMVYADIGSELMGYHSDIQPAYIVGKGSVDQVKLVELSLKMLRAMIASTRPGVTDTQVLKAAYQAAGNSPFRDYIRTWTFGHGYGVGSDLPDMTGATLTLPKKQQLKLKENMVLCYEPGIFVPGLGGAAVEDEVIVTANSCKVITKCAERAQELINQQNQTKES